jgi:hypothetical protein
MITKCTLAWIASWVLVWIGHTDWLLKTASVAEVIKPILQDVSLMLAMALSVYNYLAIKGKKNENRK